MTGWILLALCVALVNAGSGITALWVLLTALGYTLFLAFAVRPAFLWILNSSPAIQDRPSQGIVALTHIIALTSPIITGIIGIHPIFGAFMAGLICPHQGGFAIKITEKIEDLVSAIFLPLYFALSGLSTNLGLLDNGITWAYVIGVIAVAFCGKFIGATLAAKLNGYVWRECFTIGSLMSCKGLVELIVLVSDICDISYLNLLTFAEHRSPSQDLEYAHIYNLRCHGPCNDLRYYPLDLLSLSTLVSEENRAMETWRN